MLAKGQTAAHSRGQLGRCWDLLTPAQQQTVRPEDFQVLLPHSVTCRQAGHGMQGHAGLHSSVVL